MIKTIKRKNAINHHNIQVTPQDQEVGLIEYCKKELNSKKISKTNLEKLLSFLMKSLNETNEKQSNLETKVEHLGKQNEEFILQNQQMLQEIINKGEYTKKLETLLFFILEYIIPKHTFKNENKNTLLSSSNASNSLVSNNEFKIKTTNENNRSNFVKNALEGLGENFFKTILDKYIEYTQSNNLKDLNGLGLITSNAIASLKQDKPLMLGNESVNTNLNSNLNNLAENTHPYNFENTNNMLDDDKNIFSMKHNSPNPFIDDFNFSQNNIFNSPSRENFNYNMYKIPNENKENSEADNNLLADNFPLNLSRNNSVDLNDYFKNNEDDKKGNFIPGDESYFSISSDKNK